MLPQAMIKAKFIAVFIAFSLVSTSCGQSKAPQPTFVQEKSPKKVKQTLGDTSIEPIKPALSQKEESSSKNDKDLLVANIHENPIIPNTYEFSQGDELDLHSKKIAKAREMIETFLHDAQNLGKKFVLIITGKGRHSKEKFLLDDGSEVGPIKYNFLKWFQQGDFSGSIKRLSYANGVHGGEGAFYIELK